MDSSTAAETKSMEGNPSTALKSNRLRYYRHIGRHFSSKAETVLNHESYFNAYFLKFDEGSFFYYRASIAFRACERWRDAGECLVKCANIFLRQKMFSEAAVLFAESAEVLMKIDKGECVKCMEQSISIYCDVGRFDIAAKLEREVALIHFESMDWDESLMHFKRASEFFLSEQMFEQSSFCLDQSAMCLMEIGEYGNAYEVYLSIARACIESNLLFFNHTEKIFKAVLCLFALSVEKGDKRGVAKYQNISKILDDMKKEFFMWGNSKENLFLRNMIKIRMDADIDAFADHLYFWDNVKPLDKYSTQIMESFMIELKKEATRRSKERAKKQAAEDKKTLQAKRQERRVKELRRKGLLIGGGAEEDKSSEKQVVVTTDAVGNTEAKDDALREGDGENSMVDSEDELFDEIEDQDMNDPKPT